MACQHFAYFAIFCCYVVSLSLLEHRIRFFLEENMITV